VRSVELAVFADDLCAESSALAARAERARSRLRQAALEREARRSLSAAAAELLEARGILGRHDERSLRAELRELEAATAALEELQAWVESELARSSVSAV
jgi:hypothetical protein